MRYIYQVMALKNAARMVGHTKFAGRVSVLYRGNSGVLERYGMLNGSGCSVM